MIRATLTLLLLTLFALIGAYSFRDLTNLQTNSGLGVSPNTSSFTIHNNAAGRLQDAQGRDLYAVTKGN